MAIIDFKSTKFSNKGTVKAKKRDRKNLVIKRIKRYQKLDFERISNWIPAGSGNYEKTQDDGRYRESCNTYRGESTCEDHPHKSLKIELNHCNKLN